MNKILIIIGISIAAWVSLVSCKEKENAEKRTVIPVRLGYDGRNAGKTQYEIEGGIS